MLAKAVSPERFDHLEEPRTFQVSNLEKGYEVVEEAEVRKLYPGLNGKKIEERFSRSMYIAGIKIVEGSARLVMSSQKRTTLSGIDYILADTSEMPRLDFIGKYVSKNIF